MFALIAPLIIIVAFLLVFSLFMSLCAVVASRAKLKPLIADAYMQKMIVESGHWAEEQGFRFAGFFSYAATPIAIWYHPERSSLFMQYFFLRVAFEIETVYEGHIALSTATAKNALLIPPPPGYYIQSFSKLTLHELWERHLKSERFLLDNGHVRFTPRTPEVQWPPENLTHDPIQGNDMFVRDNNPYAVLYDESQLMPLRSKLALAEEHMLREHTSRVSRMQGKYCMSLPLWFLRWSYWGLVRQPRMFNQSLETLIENGWYDLPQNLPFDHEKWYK